MFELLNKLFSWLMKSFLSDLLSEALGVFDKILVNLSDVGFYAETYIKSDIGIDFSNLFTVLRWFGIYLIILMCLKKGFEIYILWTDGDADMDPFILLTNFCKAIVVAITFEELYGILIKIALDIQDKVLSSLSDVNLSSQDVSKLLANFMNKGLILTIVSIVYLVYYLILWIQFIRRGLEVFVLKIGVPIACIGLMNSDGGVFKPYIKKLIQEIITVIIQTFFLKLSIVFMLNGNFMFGIAALISATKAPQFLQDFIIAYSGNSGGISKVTQGMYTAKMIKSFVK